MDSIRARHTNVAGRTICQERRSKRGLQHVRSLAHAYRGKPHQMHTCINMYAHSHISPIQMHSCAAQSHNIQVHTHVCTQSHDIHVCKNTVHAHTDTCTLNAHTQCRQKCIFIHTNYYTCKLTYTITHMKTCIRKEHLPILSQLHMHACTYTCGYLHILTYPCPHANTHAHAGSFFYTLILLPHHQALEEGQTSRGNTTNSCTQAKCVKKNRMF